MRLLDLFVFKYNRTDFHELNLDWIISDMRTLAETLEKFVSLNTIKYADPIQWNITKQYGTNTVVIDPATGIAYISTQPVPNGVNIGNTDYWTVVFDLSAIISNINNNLTTHDDGSNTVATFASSTGDWLLLNDKLYEVTADITIGTTYTVNSNIEQRTVEDFVKSLINQINTNRTAIAANTASIGDLDNLNTTDKTSLVNAINEIADEVGDLDDLNTTDKSSIVNAINEALTIVGNAPSIFVYPEQYGAVGDGVTDDADAIEACCTYARYNGYGVAFKGKTYACERAIDLTGNFIIGVPNRSTIKYTGTTNIPEASGAFVTRTGWDRGLTFGIVIDCSNNADVALNISYPTPGASIQHRLDHVWVEYYDTKGIMGVNYAEAYMINCGTTPSGHANTDGLCAVELVDYGGPIVCQDCNFTGGYIRIGAQYIQLINCVTTGIHLAGTNCLNDVSIIGGYCHNDRLYGGNLTIESTTRCRNLTFIGTYIQNDEAGSKSVLGGSGSWDCLQITFIGCHFLDTLATPTNVLMLSVGTPSPSHSSGCAISLQGCFFPGGNVFTENAPNSGWRYDNINSRNQSYLNHLADITIFEHFMQQRNLLKYFCSTAITAVASGNTTVIAPFNRNTGVGLFIAYSTDGDFYIGAHHINAGTIGTLTDLYASGNIKARFGGGTSTQAFVIQNAATSDKTVYLAFIGLTTL